MHGRFTYWVYIVHLPVLCAIQYRLLDAELGWGAKFAISVVAASALCLLSYQVFVRKTVIGKLLGTRPAVAQAAAA